ncbi:protein of unknown function DUF842 containing protein [Nitzschia inconspicua]|uniref:Protein FAM136A n=1 Tax=Nitzschia inconspicua TaxID=303405 RepID=A0A9K3KYI2_9STRA|nr:protein of unknown function DUF842 containing protein [Nitzschia inconspicua]
MSNPQIQAQANALNAKMETEATQVLDDIERNWMRKVARESFACAVKCYDKAGKSGPAEALEQCARKCQMPYQQASALVQQEVNQFQNRLNRNMQECQEQARDRIQPGMENDPSKMAAIEQSLLDCMSKQVNEHIKLLQPMKNRITAALKNFK